MPRTANEVTLLDRLVEAFPEEITYLSTAPIELRIDDRDSEDRCYSFCEITLKVTDLDSGQFQVVLQNVPWDEQVKATVADMSPTWETCRSGMRLTVTIGISRLNSLKRLAQSSRWPWTTLPGPELEVDCPTNSQIPGATHTSDFQGNLMAAESRMRITPLSP